MSWKSLACGLIGAAWCWQGIPGGYAYDLRDNAILHARNGQLLMERGKTAEAIEEFKAGLRLNPYTSLSASLYNNLGLAYVADKRYVYAFVSLQRACRLQPTSSLYYRNLVEAYLAAGLALPFENALLRLVRGNPANAEAWYLLGLLYQEQQNRQAARQCFAQYLKLEPESEKARAAREAL